MNDRTLIQPDTEFISYLKKNGYKVPFNRGFQLKKNSFYLNNHKIKKRVTN